MVVPEPDGRIPAAIEEVEQDRVFAPNNVDEDDGVDLLLLEFFHGMRDIAW